MTDLSRKGERRNLKKRHDPYWMKLGKGRYLGFRRGSDTWLARFLNRDGKYEYKALEGCLEFDEAKATAEAWFGQMSGTPVVKPKRGSVREALESYLEWLKQGGREATAREAEGRFKTVVWNDRLAALSVESLTITDMEVWRDRLKQGRKARSINRHVRAVKAGLNVAVSKRGFVGNPAAWRLDALQDDVDDDGETAVLLSPEQRAELIKAAAPSCAAFLRGLEVTGARPKELAAATVADFTGESIRLASRKGRSGKLRVRYSLLSTDGAAFIKSQCKGKLPTAAIFTEDGSQTWRRHVWAREIRAGIKKHNQKARGKKRIPPAASAYSFRHARISELLQVHGVDPLTVAMQCGTSVAMIERAYHRFIPSAMREKLAAISEA